MQRQKWLIAVIIMLCLAVTLMSGCFIIGSRVTGTSLSDFPDSETLSAWVADHIQSFEPGNGAEAWYQAALTVQREAAGDGYLVSAVITAVPDSSDEYMVWCTALAGGDLYWWHPEDSEPSLMFKAEELSGG